MNIIGIHLWSNSPHNRWRVVRRGATPTFARRVLPEGADGGTTHDPSEPLGVPPALLRLATTVYSLGLISHTLISKLVLEQRRFTLRSLLCVCPTWQRPELRIILRSKVAQKILRADVACTGQTQIAVKLNHDLVGGTL